MRKEKEKESFEQIGNQLIKKERKMIVQNVEKQKTPENESGEKREKKGFILW